MLTIFDIACCDVNVLCKYSRNWHSCSLLRHNASLPSLNCMSILAARCVLNTDFLLGRGGGSSSFVTVDMFLLMHAISSRVQRDQAYKGIPLPSLWACTFHPN